MYTTEDFLLYLAGVPVDAPPRVRQKRIEALDVPDVMREELVRISGEVDAIQAAAPKEAPKARSAPPATVDVPKRVLTRRRS